MSLIDGVAGNDINEPGTLIQVSLRPDADEKKVARAVQQVLRKHSVDPRVVQVRLVRNPAIEGLRPLAAEDQHAVAQATRMPTTGQRRSWKLLALLVGCAALGLGLIRWRHAWKNWRKGAWGV